MKKYRRPHEYQVACRSCRAYTVVHARLKRVIKRCPRCGAQRPLIDVVFKRTNTKDPVVR